MITLCDPKSWSSRPVLLDYTPDTRTGFMWWHGEIREICEIHQTANGMQIELY